MKIKIALILSLALFAVTSCAKRPNAIVPVDVANSTYEGFSCLQLAQEQAKEQEKLAALSKKQNGAANVDALGVFLVGIPVGSLANADVEGQIAVSKGRLVSMGNVLISKRCNA